MTVSSPVMADNESIEAQVTDFKERYQSIEHEIGKVIVGHKEVVSWRCSFRASNSRPT